MGTPIKDLPEHTQRAIQNALDKETRKEVKNNESWVKKTEDMRAIIVAIEGAKNRVVLSLGVFEMHPVFHDGSKGYWLKPADGRFVPCGFFTVFKLNSMIANKEISGE